MGHLVVRVQAPNVVDNVGDVPLPVDNREDVIVTDDEAIAKRANGFVAFLSTDLRAIMRVLATSRVLGVIHPDRLSDEIVAALASRSKIYSWYTADDWHIETAHYELISSVANGDTRAQAAERAGYSERQARRILARIAEEARVEGDFNWGSLAPLLAE